MEEQNLKDLLDARRQESRQSGQTEEGRKQAMAAARFGGSAKPATPSADGGASAGAGSSMLKNSEESQQAADTLRQSRRSQRESTVDPLTAHSSKVDERVGGDPGGAYDHADDMINDFQTASTPDAKKEALQAAYHFAGVLRENVKKYSPSTYLLVMFFIAAPLDILAIPAEGTGPLWWAFTAVTAVVRFFLWVAVNIFLAGRGTKTKVRVIIWAIGVVCAFLEVTPLIDIIPFYSLNVLVAQALAWRESRRNKEAAKKVEKQIKKMLKGGEKSPRKGRFA